MDYVVGNVAALISGNVTPNRPKLSKRALTPIKHMPSPNVTPKSEFVEDRSVFLSPSVQKKKAIVKKSPKRIFQNPDLDVTNENDGNTSTSSPKADKVKKHLKGELEANVSPKTSSKAVKSPESKRSKSVESPSPRKIFTNGDVNSSTADNVTSNELMPKKKKKQRNSITETNQSVTESIEPSNLDEGTPKKGKKQNKHTDNVQNDTETNINADESVTGKTSKKNNKNRNKSQSIEQDRSVEPEKNVNSEENETETPSQKKKNKKRKKTLIDETEANEDVESKPAKNKKMKVNPNAITDKDSDSEHESDNEIESETEENNKEMLDNSVEAEEQSSDEEEEAPATKNKKKAETQETEKVKEVNTEEEIKRTLFVGNVLFSKKCKKEIKKIFSKYGQIESVRIRTVPVKDPSVTPKLAVIKQELHPERSTVNVYVKFTHPKCVDEALAENNTVLNNNHLRVTRSGSTGAEHDPRHSVFVGNIPFALEDEGLREKFQGCGDIESVRIVRDKKTNAGKGFGYVNFTSRDGVELALALTDEDLTIKNRIMRVKRCTQATQRQAQRGAKGASDRPAFQGRNKVSQGDRQRNNQGPSQFSQGRNFSQGRGGFQGRGGRGGGRGQGSRGGFQGSRGGFQGSRGGFQGSRGGFQGSRGGFQGSRGGFQGNRGGFQGNKGGNFGRQEGEHQEGAHRRLMHKRKSQEGGEGPPNKMARDDQPREKKARKEFVGMTAEKKKKRKMDKGQKKKKVLSEILTK